MEEKTSRTEPVARTSPNLLAEKLAALRAVVPEVFSEGKLDVTKLREALGDAVDERPERYGLSWTGKRDAIRLLQTPSRATLVPAPEESVDFDTSLNAFIEGDNLETLKLLHKSYAGRIDAIYIDPPYNTGDDRLYEDDFTDPLAPYLRLTGQQDGNGNSLTTNPQTSGRFHSAWLKRLYPRLFVARQLLTEGGLILISIDDMELHNLRMICDEIFGEENWLGTLIWKGATDNNPTRIAIEHEYLVCYARSKNAVTPVWKNGLDAVKEVMLAEYERLRKSNGEDAAAIQLAFRRFIKNNKESLSPITHYDRVDKRGPYTGSRSVHNPRPGGHKYPVYWERTDKVCAPPANGYRYPKETMDDLIREERIIFGEDESQVIQIKEYLKDYEAKLASVISLDSRVASNDIQDLFPECREIFPNSKPAVLLREILTFCAGKDALILDFYVGSGTTVQAVMEMNERDGGSRRVIAIQLPEHTGPETAARKCGYATIADIAKERIRRAIKRIKSQKDGTLPFAQAKPAPDLGFRVFHLDESRFKQWTGTESKDPVAYAERMALYNDPLVKGWMVADVIWEVAVKQGYSLSSQIEKDKTINGNTVWRVIDGERGQSFRICFDDKLTTAAVKKLELTQGELFVCRDAAIDDDVAANLALQCELRTI